MVLPEVMPFLEMTIHEIFISLLYMQIMIPHRGIEIIKIASANAEAIPS
jgi:hypothetical protein